ncbi:MarR family winged helix-turn-helix transcriptional regulator [Streptomyces yaanensis]|uniref:MarR family winged helix-turn-helix transcriptional regulator n=1 Tax=Streptomyces yaanensis TaxID=1142239 RepID=A0ABV7SEU3_9ACTN|nr:MarR family winged helix-turn-helix transcriptional regulator [Streptomyces sp. CGMCC 4.7035]WNB97886.1 MarR family winged helix-turn-helix transcriptional regulator [Streptomyces sp. CGMCC 4.7035]
MENEATGPLSGRTRFPGDGGDDQDDDPSIDYELIGGWKLVMEGFRATHQSFVSELAKRFDLGPGAADVLLRILISPKHRMPMTRLAHEAGMSSGGFTKLADRLCAAALTQRVSCDADRRVTYLELTERGEETARSVSRVATEILRTRVLGTLGCDGFRNLAGSMRELRDANVGPGK